MSYDDKDWFEPLLTKDGAATMSAPPGGDDLLAVCSACSTTVDLTQTCQRVVDGGVKIVCLSCLTGDTDAIAEVAAETPAREDDTTIPVIVADAEEAASAEAPTAPSFIPRARHLAVAGAAAAVVAAIVVFAPGATAPAAKAPASVTATAPTHEIDPPEVPAAEPEEPVGLTGELTEREKAIAYRDAIRASKRDKELRREEIRKRKPRKGRRFGRHRLGVLPVSLRGENWIYPLPGMEKRPSTAFGKFGARRRHRFYRPSCGRGHCGYDLKGPWNMPIVSVLPGTVERVVWRSRRPSGRYVVINHGHGLRTWYMHLHRPRHGLRPGMQVNAGEEIGRLGTTGLIDKIPHLHFSLEKANEFYVDPEPFLELSTAIAKPRAAAIAKKNRM